MAGIPLLGVLGLPWSQNAISGGGVRFSEGTGTPPGRGFAKIFFEGSGTVKQYLALGLGFASQYCLSVFRVCL